MKTSFLMPLIKYEKLRGEKYSSLYIDLKNETLKYAPMALRYKNAADYKDYLERTLPQNSPNTRKINAYEIIRRFHKKELNRLFSQCVKAAVALKTKNELFWFEFVSGEKFIREFTVKFLYKRVIEGKIKKETVQAFVTLAFGGKNEKTYYNLKNIVSKCGLWAEDKENFITGFYKPSFGAFCYGLYREFGDDKFSDDRLSRCLTKKIFLMDNLTFEDYVHSALKLKLASFSYSKKYFYFELALNEKKIADLIKNEKNS